MLKSIYSVTLLLSCLLLTGCGYFYSGTWEDDPDTWERVYGYEKPNEIQVVHSWYWRSPHFTMEYELYMETTLNKDIIHSFLSKGDMVQRPGYVNESVGDLVDYDTRPAWFGPKTLDKYEVWVSNNPEEFKFFIDRDTGHLYWHEIQL
jgi:hypothetical protein